MTSRPDVGSQMVTTNNVGPSINSVAEGGVQQEKVETMDCRLRRGPLLFSYPPGTMMGAMPGITMTPTIMGYAPPCGPCVPQIPCEQHDSLNATHQYRQLFDSVVKVFCTSCGSEPDKPWQQGDQEMSSATGFIVSYGNGEQGVVTNAHAVSDAVDVKVKLHGLPKKYPAKVACIAHELDLALIKVENLPENQKYFQFAQGKSVPFDAKLPAALSDVVVVGYPTGGQALSSTKGVVNRNSVVKYAHGKKPGLVIQIDAPINHGNSGGPTISRGKVVGVAFQGKGNAQSIGYIIPASVVLFFLGQASLRLKRVLYFEADFRYVMIDNASLAEFFGMNKSQTGILVTKIPSGNEKNPNNLQKFDVILAVDHKIIASDATIEIGKGDRVAWQQVLQTKSFQNPFCVFTILRQRHQMDLRVQLRPNSDIAPRHLYDRKPSYFVFGGCVFVPLSLPYLQNSMGGNFTAEIQELKTRLKSDPDEEVVILSQVLACKVADGYQTHSDLILEKANGHEVKNLEHLMQIVHSSKKYVMFEFKSNVVIVLDVQQAQHEQPAILAQNKIGSAFYLDHFNSDCCTQNVQCMTKTPAHVQVNCAGCGDLLGLVKLLAAQGSGQLGAGAMMPPQIAGGIGMGMGMPPQMNAAIVPPPPQSGPTPTITVGGMPSCGAPGMIPSCGVPVIRYRPRGQ